MLYDRAVTLSYQPPRGEPAPSLPLSLRPVEYVPESARLLFRSDFESELFLSGATVLRQHGVTIVPLRAPSPYWDVGYSYITPPRSAPVELLRPSARAFCQHLVQVKPLVESVLGALPIDTNVGAPFFTSGPEADATAQDVGLLVQQAVLRGDLHSLRGSPAWKLLAVLTSGYRLQQPKKMVPYFYKAADGFLRAEADSDILPRTRVMWMAPRWLAVACAPYHDFFEARRRACPGLYDPDRSHLRRSLARGLLPVEVDFGRMDQTFSAEFLELVLEELERVAPPQLRPLIQLERAVLAYGYEVNRGVSPASEVTLRPRRHGLPSGLRSTSLLGSVGVGIHKTYVESLFTGRAPDASWITEPEKQARPLYTYGDDGIQCFRSQQEAEAYSKVLATHSAPFGFRSDFDMPGRYFLSKGLGPLGGNQGLRMFASLVAPERGISDDAESMAVLRVGHSARLQLDWGDLRYRSCVSRLPGPIQRLLAAPPDIASITAPRALRIVQNAEYSSVDALLVARLAEKALRFSSQYRARVADARGSSLSSRLNSAVGPASVHILRFLS